ncbi:kinesin family member 18/19 [Candida albicans P87]|nr:kinesin family member 18/19 [Candida albicans GC75]KGU10417.1 kinesin family member 18/19 [Candida albicans P87]KGU31391.1 kinesin family member 18/19 [Candida albicans P75063]KHC42454.1 kinesin family member 18/19 [Candida albicans Ca6]KHC70300.1 kinesin family member 18/19 [Candida albicans P75016]
MSYPNSLGSPATVTSTSVPTAKQSSISVAVRVRPFTEAESNRLVKIDNDDVFLGDGCLTSDNNNNNNNSNSNGNGNGNGSSAANSSGANTSRRAIFNTLGGLRKIINVVDDRMLIFDPPETNPLTKMQRNAFPNSFKGSRIREHRFVFDRLFDEDCTQDQVYRNTTQPLLDSVLDGYNATVFAYGATGCGKTHTISGTPEDPGVIFLTMKELYNRIEELKDTKIIDVSLSYLEIYNETIRDLLNPMTQCKNLVIREDANNKISVSNLSRHRPNSVEEVMQLILEGNKNRTCSPTEANATSSRSHAVLQINVIQKDRTGDITEEHTFATLSIIDLAGSERAAATKNRGARLNEGANINKSLLALGNCINALCDPRRRNHVPYRDSKLTRLLKFSLGGNCKTVMIVCVSPSSQHYDETLNTLKYADRAKEIKTKLIRNQHNLDRHVGSYLKMITEQKQEIEELRARESKMVESTINKRKDLESKVFKILFESLESTRKAIAKQNQEKWKKYFILAKRKLLLSQKIETELVLEQRDDIDINSLSIASGNESESVFKIYDLCEQLISKIEYQLPQLESQYSQPTDLDYILEDSAMQTLKRLQDEEGWTEHHSAIYRQSIQSMKREVHTDLLLYSSILYDNLIHDLSIFFYIPREIGNFINNISNPTSLNEANQELLYNMTLGLENLLNGEFDSAMEQYAMDYMKNKVESENQTQTQTQTQNQNQNQVNSYNPDESMMSIDNDIIPIKKQRILSPPRQLKKPKKSTQIPPITRINNINSGGSGGNGNSKLKKPSHWGDRDKSDLMYDTSMEENSLITSEINFDEPDGGGTPVARSSPPPPLPPLVSSNKPPNVHNILADVNELDLPFNPTIESSPTQVPTSKLIPPTGTATITDRDDIDNSNNNINGNGNGNANNFTNKRLLTDLKRSRSSSLMSNKKIMMNFTDSKLPLLNKQAASKISNDN